MSRQHGSLHGRNCKLLCPTCSDLKKVKQVLSDAESPTIAVLECGHMRPAELLPLKHGRISLEHMSREWGRECFPPITEALAPAWRN
jgi:hypothetical protein